MHTKDQMKFSTRLDCVFGAAICVFAFSFLFYFIEKHVSHGILFVSGSRALCTGSTTSLTKKIFTRMCSPVGLVHYSWDPQTSFFNKIFIKNGCYGTIHTFKHIFNQMI